MKTCLLCHRYFPSSAVFCVVDGAQLVATSSNGTQVRLDLRIGKILCGRYKLQRVVADGGVGRVYEAMDQTAGRRVAVKILDKYVVRQDPSAVGRFKQEYEVSTQLPHDFIVHMFDCQQDPTEGVWLIVMEFLEGKELRHILDQERWVHPGLFIRILSQIALGLDAAHARRFVHRDLKPDNLFICQDEDGGSVKILDFGSVKNTNEGAQKLTQMGMTIGSPFYMAPEQTQGLDSLDARADIFSLGAITYECLTGVLPFSGQHGISVMLAILTKEPIPISAQGKNLPFPTPSKMDSVIRKALEKEPSRRYETVGAFADAVGWAYGLSGSHAQWACTAAQELKERCVQQKGSAAFILRVDSDPFHSLS
ncbi:serine/threonine protein kinase [Pajaroellobacter abortibovis]|uniref:Protein kinase domain-containing protein n=1 Tax=Pajaroellobacter abortibovis TaxID=1882918 RepID=A0A1L6MVQ6_9BACT|nr:serine/threonine-protein kinase [Pajaroellobacter abortibovis]APR99568.1 hypothetical protein BCY86_01890 [Pajaroellobacter abortibovis]